MTAPLVVILLTYQRTGYMRTTVQALRANLRYAGRVLWFVADDGSEMAHLDAVRAELAGTELLGWYSERNGYGHMANIAWDAASQVSPLTLWLEDDWTLTREHDFTQYGDILETRADIGMIRLAQMVENIKCQFANVAGRHYLAVDWDQHYAFSGNPSMRHSRARAAWGPYPEGLKPGDTEVNYDWRVSQAKGPRIMWPVDIGGWGLFGHIGGRPSYIP